MGISIQKLMPRRLIALAALSLIAGVGVHSTASSARGGLVIVPSYDATINSDPNATAIKNGIQSAINVIQSKVLSNVTVSITFTLTNSGLGSNTTLTGAPAYSDYKTALTTQQQLSTNDATHIANMPVTSIVNVIVTGPLMRALNLPGAPTGTDSTISLNTSQMNLSRTGPQTPGKSDLQTTAEHEIIEVLGAGGQGSQVGNASFFAGPLDFDRYTSAGVRSSSTSNNISTYFSINGGVTQLVHFNQSFGADYGDWGNGVVPAQIAGNTPPQVQDAYSTPLSQVDIGTNEIIALDVIGWNVVPEPSCVGLLALGAMTLLGTRRPRR